MNTVGSERAPDEGPGERGEIGGGESSPRAAEANGAAGVMGLEDLRIVPLPRSAEVERSTSDAGVSESSPRLSAPELRARWAELTPRDKTIELLKHIEFIAPGKAYLHYAGLSRGEVLAMADEVGRAWLGEPIVSRDLLREIRREVEYREAPPADVEFGVHIDVPGSSDKSGPEQEALGLNNALAADVAVAMALGRIAGYSPEDGRMIRAEGGAPVFTRYGLVVEHNAGFFRHPSISSSARLPERSRR